MEGGETCFGDLRVGVQAMNERSIFMEALDFDEPRERWAYILRACGGDERLRALVEALLRRHQADDKLALDRMPAVDPSVTEDLTQPVEKPGTSIGVYKLREQIGEGGMGVVYVAEQTRPVRRKVALKIIKPGMDTKQVIARFEAERQALAMMDHPNIAKVLDAGTTDEGSRHTPCAVALADGTRSVPATLGRPYFVMELVRGIPITDYCDRERLTIPERLELFVLVCRAVQHAHQKGIIHRDLKPSNILVTMIDGAAVPKVIDFGVAKATGASLTERTIYTAFQQFVGTPLYMSPEQADLSGMDVDTRSDIYSLGVLLYELLTGTTPFDQETFRTAALDEMRRIIREQEPPKPSTRISTLGGTATTLSANRQTDPWRLRRSLRGELDWIVMKCLEKDRNRRYETANSLVADLRRYLNHEPVEAGPPSIGYRLRKAARRNRAALVTAAVLATALVAGTAVSTWEAIRATKAEGLADNRLKAESAARQEAGRLLGQVTEERNRVAQEKNRADQARQEADRRATEAREVVDFLINDLIGAASPSQAQGKIPTVDQVLARADRNIAQKFAGRPLIEASIRHALGQAYEELGQYPKAEQHAARAVELRMKHLGSEHVDTIAAQNALGWVLDRQEKTEEVRTLLTPVLETARKALGPEHPEMLQTMEVLAVALPSDQGRALEEELLAIRKRVLGPEHLKTLSSMNDLAVIWERIGNLEKAMQLYEQVVTTSLRDRRNHPDTLISMGNLANLYGSLGQHDRAIEMRRRIVDAHLRVLGLAHPFTGQAIGSYFDSARRDRAHRAEARKTLEPILERSRRELGPEAELTMALSGWLANTFGMLGQTERAIATIDALPENRKVLPVREELARYLYLYGNRDAALVQFQRVETLRSRLVPADDPFGLEIRNRLALVLREHGRFAEARPLLEQVAAEALRLRRKDPKPNAQIERARGIAQLLLKQWPGLAPGIKPAERPPASFVIEAPFRARSPVADGRIEAGEYGPGIEVAFGDANPGRLYAFGQSRSKTPDDLSVRFHAVYTDRSLFLAFRVRDQLVTASELRARVSHTNDSIDVFLNGDLVANDHTPVFSTDDVGNREGFQLRSDVAGHRGAAPADLTNADWKIGTSRTADGYIMEFEIPLALIDTRDGPEYVPATSGSEIRFNFGIADYDDAHAGSDHLDYGILWAEDPALSPYDGGEDFWTVALRLVPKPAGP
jgi:serine/threonine protein kinase/tetratricopeptide (TPR) repeat protein